METNIKTQIINYKAKLEGARRKKLELETKLYSMENEIELLVCFVGHLEKLKEKQNEQ